MRSPIPSNESPGFLALDYPCLIIGPLQVLFESAEKAWIAHFMPSNLTLEEFATIKPEGIAAYLRHVNFAERVERFPKNVWREFAYKVLLQKYEKPTYVKLLLSPHYRTTYRVMSPANSPVIQFWYDSAAWEPWRQGALIELTNQIRAELFAKYSQPLLAKTELGKHIRTTSFTL